MPKMNFAEPPAPGRAHSDAGRADSFAIQSTRPSGYEGAPELTDPVAVHGNDEGLTLDANHVRFRPVFAVLWVGLVAGPAAMPAAQLKQATLDAFHKYVREAEARRAKRLRPGEHFLWADESAERLRLVQQGRVAIKPNGAGEVKIPDGLIHDWIGAIFIPGATLERTLALVHDYNSHKWIYKPEVLDSRLISQDGNEYRTSVRMQNSRAVTLVLDADYDIRYVPLDRTRWYSDSRSIRVREVENAGAVDERDLPDGVGRGLLWRLNTHSRFEERDGGVYVECEAIALSRGYPFGLAWAIRPIIRDVPGQSMTKMLSAMRSAVLAVESGRLQTPRPATP